MSFGTSINNCSTGTGGSQSEPFRDLYVYEMPSAKRRELCTFLDEFSRWERLADSMQYKKEDLQVVKHAAQRGHSPSDELLVMWGNLNHTVTELFMVFNKMKLYDAMKILQGLVQKEYHRLITNSLPALSVLMGNGETKSKKMLNCPSSQILSNSNNLTTSSYDDESSDKPSIDDYRNVEKYANAIPDIEYRELVEATDKWNADNVLGKGGFGTVYKGMWKLTAVAIKRIEYHGTASREAIKIQFQQSTNELKYLNSCRHDNILPLYGYSKDGNEPCLVYQLMTGGSLEERLRSRKYKPLTCQERLTIAQGTARGLQYLHTFKEKPLIHGDIKPANILLDPCNQPKIGDFGLAREGPNTLNSSMEVSRVFGTRPYLPNDFVGSKSLSTKVDTYSFGIVLFEIVTGQRVYDTRRNPSLLPKYIISKIKTNVATQDLMDKNLIESQQAINICHNMMRIGIGCISEKADDRPEMTEVYNALTYRI